MTKYTFSKDVGPSDWHPLPREFKAGDHIFRFSGHDYGCARDDMMYGNRETISCCEVDGQAPSFTIPVEFLLTESGEHPMGEYTRIPR